MQAEERVTLAALRQQGQSLRQIGQVLGRSAGSLCRELGRNEQAGQYSSRAAQQACEQRRRNARPKPKLDPDGRLWPVVCERPAVPS